MNNYSDKLKDPRWQKKSGIYKIIIDKYFYIGSAINLKKRLGQHLSNLKAKRHHNRFMQNVFNKYQKIDFEIIEFVKEQDLIIREQYYIDKLKPQLNIAPKAGNQLGFKHSENTKKHLSEIQIGKIITMETRRKMSESKKGWSPTLEQRINYSKAKMGKLNPFYKAGKNHPQYGKKRRPETIEKLSGKNNYQAKSGILYDVETNTNYIFQCLKTICRKLNLEYRGILSALRKERFYRDRYYINFISISKNIETNIQ